MVILYTLLSVVGVSLLSILGIVFFYIDEAVMRQSLLYFVSISTGALLGDVFIHIVPELAETSANFSHDLLVLLGGIVFSFALEKLIHWRHCHILPSAQHVHPMGLVNVIGESFHNFIDGIVIAAGFIVSIPVGISTSVAVMFHEIPHEVGNVAILLHSGYSKKRALLFNALSGSMSILGALLALSAAGFSRDIQGMMLPFAAGNLLYIAGSDLIPELHKETRLRQAILQLACMILGMVMMYALLFLE